MAKKNKKTDKAPTTNVDGDLSAEQIKANNVETQRIANEKAETQRISDKKAETQRIADEKAETQRIADEEAEIKNVNPTVKRQLEAKKLRAKAGKEIADKAKLVAKEEVTKTDNAKTTKEVKDTRPTFTDDRGLKFKFKKTAPKTLNIDGVSRKISDIIKDNDLMLELTSGNNNQIEQIY